MRRALPSILSVALALLVSFVAAALTLGSWTQAAQAYGAMVTGAFGDWGRFFETGSASAVLRPLGEAANKAAILTLTGLSVAVALRVGLFNIGAQGQMVVGAFAAAVVGAHLHLPAGLHAAAAIAASMVCGALWALPTVLLRQWRGVHEVISTIMLNWVALALVENWLVLGPFKARAMGNESISGTAQIQPSAELFRFFPELSRMNLSVVLALGLAAILAFWMSKTWRGFEMRVVGLSPKAAETAGILVSNRLTQGMALSGSLAGLAGAVTILGSELKYPATLASTYGFDGIAVALLGQIDALGVVVAAATFGALRAGGTHMQLHGVHKSFPELILGLALLFLAARLFRSSKASS